jgi:hypothetical protein
VIPSACSFRHRRDTPYTVEQRFLGRRLLRLRPCCIGEVRGGNREWLDHRNSLLHLCWQAQLG